MNFSFERKAFALAGHKNDSAETQCSFEASCFLNFCEHIDMLAGTD
jgi:hypothetical protein